MPKLDIVTANGRAAVPSMGVDARSFGGQLAEPLNEFGRQMEAVGDKLQRQRDDIEIVDRAAYFDQQLATKYQDILKDDSLRGETVQETVTNRMNALKRFSREHDEGIGETQTQQVMGPDGSVQQKDVQPGSSAVQLALRKHIINQASNHAIQMQSDTLKQEANRQADDLETSMKQSVDLAALQPWNEHNHLGQMETMLARAKANKIIPEDAINKLRAGVYDRFWRQVAVQSPTRVLTIQSEMLAGKQPPANIDQAKVMEYGNIALGQLNAKQKRDEADLKEMQDKNHARATSQAIKGELDKQNLADIVDRRGIDPDKAMSLINLNEKIKDKQKEENYVDGRTPQIETRLLAMKFDQKTTPEKVEAYRQQIFDARMKDQISQRDFEHLMDTWQGVNDHIHASDKTSQNTAVSHAHEVLNKSLQVTGPMGFDSLGNQVQTSAVLDFYREVERDPKANPMDIAEKVMKRYKPIIEQRIKLGETDQGHLDTAKMDGLAARGAISKAALNEWKAKDQQNKGQKIVDDTIRDLPPPTEPTWFESIMQKVDKAIGNEPKTDAAPKPSAPSSKPKMRK